MPKLEKSPTPRALTYIRKYFKDKEFTQVKKLIDLH